MMIPKHQQRILSISLAISGLIVCALVLCGNKPHPPASPAIRRSLREGAKHHEDDETYNRTGLIDSHTGVAETGKNQTFTRLEWSSEGSAVRLNDYTFQIKGELMTTSSPSSSTSSSLP